MLLLSTRHIVYSAPKIGASRQSTFRLSKNLVSMRCDYGFRAFVNTLTWCVFQNSSQVYPHSAHHGKFRLSPLTCSSLMGMPDVWEIPEIVSSEG